MAISVTISFPTNPSIKDIGPAWWDYKELLTDYDFDTTSDKGYIDFSLSASKEVFVNMVLDQMKHLNKPMYTYPGWIRINEECMTQIDKLINKLNDEDFVRITISEWESGMD